MTTILDFSAEKARDFLLREDSYSNIDLPEYITFQKILDDIYMISAIFSQPFL